MKTKQLFTLVAALLCSVMMMAQSTSKEVNCGDSVTIKAIPDEGYHFVRWNDGNTDATRKVYVSGDSTYTAYFAANQYRLTLEVSGNGTVTGGGLYDYGTEVTITATPDACYHFENWSDDDTHPTITVTITGDMTLTAFFEVDTFTIDVKSADDNQGSAVILSE